MLGPNEYNIRFPYNGELITLVWVGASKEAVLTEVLTILQEEAWWEITTASKGLLYLRTAFIAGVEVFR